MGCTKADAIVLPTVLYVDDEPLACKYFAQTLRGTAHVVTALSADEARAVMAAADDPIDAIVSDERMPQERGVALLSDARRLQPAAKRVLTSAYSDHDALQIAINDAAVHRFLPKPWDMDTLADLMRDVLTATNAASEQAPSQATNILQPLLEVQADALEMMTMIGRQSYAPRTVGAYFASNQLQSRVARLQKSVAACLALAQGEDSRKAH